MARRKSRGNRERVVGYDAKEGYRWYWDDNRNRCCELVGWWRQVAKCDSSRFYECARTSDHTQGFNGPQIHHIVGGPSREHVLCNLITACRTAHDWCEEDPIAAKITCWRVKLEKGEFDPVETEKFWRKSVLGYLQEQKVVNRASESSVLELWRVTLIAVCEDMADAG
jgi:hypothetical protein